jgi:hypothetical protein
MEQGSKRAAYLLGAGLILAGVGRPMFAQENVDSVATRPWSVTFSLGIVSRGPEGRLEDAVTTAGFNQTSPSNWFGPAQHHPFSRGTGNTPWMVALRYDVHPPLQLGLIISNVANGETVGYRDQMYLFASYSILTVGALAYVHVGSFRFGLGPAIHAVTSGQDDAGRSAHDRSEMMLGAIVEAGMSSPAQSLFFFDLDFQYCFAGKATFGPYTVSFINTAAMMPAVDVNVSGSVVTIGAGIRF